VIADGQILVEEGRRWLGTPWQHQACLRGVGCDCVGLLGGIAAAVGVTDVWLTEASAEFKSYGRQPLPEALLAGCERFLVPAKPPAQLGDVLVFAFVRGQPQHFALLSRLDPPYILHAHISARRVVENRLDRSWERRIVRRYRFRGIG
jgi:NlpC/P60 family putative phage cell wall peptidase